MMRTRTPRREGAKVGTSVGASLEVAVRGVGTVGADEGDGEGAADGAALGAADGVALGFAVGVGKVEAEGKLLGLNVGAKVGARVGSSVSSPLAEPLPCAKVCRTLGNHTEAACMESIGLHVSVRSQLRRRRFVACAQKPHSVSVCVRVARRSRHPQLVHTFHVLLLHTHAHTIKKHHKMMICAQCAEPVSVHH